jgi:signal transduction histidine kinase/ActR/RegA family two-component response regulator
MRFGGRNNGQGLASRGVARSAATGIAGPELVRQAVQFLLASAEADRIGVWMDVEPEPATTHGIGGFRGIVRDRDGETTPAEWERLSPEASLPLHLLSSGKSVEQDLDGAPDQLIFGVLVEIKRAVWVPVESRGRLRGVLLAGLRKKHGVLPVRLLESVSAELALAVELEEERRLARERLADLAATKQALEELADVGPTDAMLTRLMESCTDIGVDGDGLGAVFAVLRSRRDPNGTFLCESAGNGQLVERGSDDNARACQGHPISWQSGDSAWQHAIESQPMAGIWQRAEEARCTITVRAIDGSPWPRGDVSCLVAIGLEAAGEIVGVLIAGFRHASASRWAIERLGLRAALATNALILRRRNDEAARYQERQRAVLEANSGATILVEDGDAITGLSQGARELLGERPRESGQHAIQDGDPAPRKFADLFCAADRHRVEAWLYLMKGNPAREGIEEDSLEAELCVGGSVRLRCAKPGNGLAAVSLEPLAALDAAGRSDRAEAQLFNVIEWLEEGVVLFDAQQGIRAMNSRFAQIAGLDPEEAGRIKTLNHLIRCLADQAAEPEKFAKRWRDLARGADGGMREEIQLQRPVPRVLERAARPVLHSNGQEIGHVEIYRDLTAHSVFQSTLLQTEKLAALGQMVTGVAHELSNPLTSILGYAQRLFLRNEAQGQSDEVRQIFQEAERASAIVRQLLMSARESRPERGRVSLNQVVSRTMDLQKFSLGAGKVTVELDLDEALPFVLGDAGQLQQVLMNLIGNARQAIEQRGKGGSIRLSTKCMDFDRVLLAVSDDGPGIPQAIASRIFDPFFTTKPAGVGTGLGLAIVLGVVREHGGQVKVASPPGGGAVFSLEFPAAPAEESREPAVLVSVSGHPYGVPLRATPMVAPLPPPGGKAASSLAAWSGARVLVVEDEPTVGRLIGDVLEDEGFQVDVLLDVNEALARAGRQLYDLVICDMKMPEMDGQHFYQTLASAGNPLCDRFLFVTGDVLSPHTHEFLERHHLPYVPKPFRVEELTEKVRLVLDEVRPREPANELRARTNAARK